MIAQQLAVHRGCRLFASDDLDDTRSRIAAVMQQHELRPIGPRERIKAQMNFMRLPGIGVGTISFGPMALKLDGVEDYHLIIFCRSGKARVRSRHGEAEIGGTRGICFAPGDPVHAQFSTDCEQFVIRIDAPTLRRNSVLSEPVLRPEIDIADQALHGWSQVVSLMTDNLAMIDMLRGNARIATHYEQLFISSLLEGQGVPDEGRSALAPAAVKRAEAYIDEHLVDPITLGDIAAAAEVPVRTLLHSFEKFRTVSPMRHLRDRRLDFVHKRLQEGRAVTVAEVALEAGFTHLGRFSQAYRARFGEPPSTALRRALGCRIN